MLFREVYLNNAAASFPPAPGVVETVAAYMAAPPAPEGRGPKGASNPLGECRRKAGRLLGAAEEEVVLVPSATAALNMAILGLGLKAGDLAVCSVAEHNSVLRPLARLEEREHIRLEYVPLDAEGALDRGAYERLLREKPALVVLSHGGNVSGRINPVGEWFALAHEAGARTLLDAGQSAGHIPLRPRELNADMAAFSGYKGLRGPPGTGILYAASHIELEPVFTGGTGVRSESRFQPREMPLRLEAGTPNVPAFAGLGRALDYYEEEKERIMEAESRITGLLLSGLAAIPGLRLCDPRCGERLPVLSFTMDGIGVEEAGFTLGAGFGIRCRTGLHCAPLIGPWLGLSPEGSIRFSPSSTTTEEEIAYALEALRRIGG